MIPDQAGGQEEGTEKYNQSTKMSKISTKALRSLKKHRTRSILEHQ